ncbi:hypothetical protein ACJJTC_017057 [Scirpophaga incertulas]
MRVYYNFVNLFSSRHACAATKDQTHQAPKTPMIIAASAKIASLLVAPEVSSHLCARAAPCVTEVGRPVAAEEGGGTQTLQRRAPPARQLAPLCTCCAVRNRCWAARGRGGGRRHADAAAACAASRRAAARHCHAAAARHPPEVSSHLCARAAPCVTEVGRPVAAEEGGGTQTLQRRAPPAAPPPPATATLPQPVTRQRGQFAPLCTCCAVRNRCWAARGRGGGRRHTDAAAACAARRPAAARHRHAAAARHPPEVSSHLCVRAARCVIGVGRPVAAEEGGGTQTLQWRAPPAAPPPPATATLPQPVTRQRGQFAPLCTCCAVRNRCWAARGRGGGRRHTDAAAACAARRPAAARHRHAAAARHPPEVSSHLCVRAARCVIGVGRPVAAEEGGGTQTLQWCAPPAAPPPPATATLPQPVTRQRGQFAPLCTCCAVRNRCWAARGRGGGRRHTDAAAACAARRPAAARHRHAAAARHPPEVSSHLCVRAARCVIGVGRPVAAEEGGGTQTLQGQLAPLCTCCAVRNRCWAARGRGGGRRHTDAAAACAARRPAAARHRHAAAARHPPEVSSHLCVRAARCVIGVGRPVAAEEGGGTQTLQWRAPPAAPPPPATATLPQPVTRQKSARTSVYVPRRA